MAAAPGYGATAGGGLPYTSVHANYWLSGLSGHVIKHELNLPLVCTFHTLDRVKAESMPEEVEADMPHRRAEAEASIIDCSDAVLASCTVEADQIAVALRRRPGPHPHRAARRRPRLLRPGPPAPGPPRPRAAARRAPAAVRRAGSSRSSAPTWPSRRWPSCSRSGGRALPARRRRRPERARTGRSRCGACTTWPTPAACATHVHFIDPQPHELLSSYYRAADVCLVPSRSESFGLVALEAAACGTPVVASAVGGLTTLVDHGHTGLPGRRPRPGRLRRRRAPGLRRAAGGRAPLAPPRCCGPATTPGAPPPRTLVELHDELASGRLVECG